MKQPALFILTSGLSLGLWMSCQPQKPAEKAMPARPPHSQPPAPKLPEGAVKGDFDGDGTAEYVWLVPPKGVDVDIMECKGECTSYLRFSKPQFPAIPHPDCIGGTPNNLGDLNDDGGDEIGLLPEWFTSCWMNYFVYTYRAGQWQRLVKPFSTHCNQWENDVKPIEKDPDNKGFVLIRYTDFADTTFAVQTKSVPVR